LASKAQYLDRAGASQFRIRADRLRRQIRQADDAEVIRQLSKLAEEYDLLASAFDALGADYEC
jgi:hypothetical protein